MYFTLRQADLEMIWRWCESVVRSLVIKSEDSKQTD